ncbi:MAG: hypothetical protein NZ824_11205 [Candidatus Thioglobus sp.]|nr:hypothetical protein [Candidatus Thioglobus sp.]
MAKKRGVDRIRSNGGYSKANQLTKMKHQHLKSDVSWMDNLPGGTWEFPGVLRAYMQTQYDK